MSSNKIVLTSSDGETFEVEKVVASKLQIVGHMLDDECVIDTVPLRNVTGEILAMVIEYCKKHVDDVSPDDSTGEDNVTKEERKMLEDWDAEFIKDLGLDKIFHLILAANYFNVKGLLDLTCQAVADYIKDKKVEQVREIFNLENDFTAEEEEGIRKENQWAFE